MQSKGLSRVFSNTRVQKHQFFGAQLSLWSSSQSIPDYWKNHSLDWMDHCWQSNISAFKYAVYVLRHPIKHTSGHLGFSAAPLQPDLLECSSCLHPVARSDLSIHPKHALHSSLSLPSPVRSSLSACAALPQMPDGETLSTF